MSGILELHSLYKSGKLLPSTLISALHARLAALRHPKQHRTEHMQLDEHSQVCGLTRLASPAYLQEAAAQCDSVLRNTPREFRALCGIPISVKANFAVSADHLVRSDCGSDMLAEWNAPYTAHCVNRLLHHLSDAQQSDAHNDDATAGDCGAILMGMSGMDEFGSGVGLTQGSHAAHWPLRNPARPDTHTAGGSSGGAAISVAEGACLAAICSDTCGSARIPAAHCALAGFKPSYAAVLRHGLVPLCNALDCVSVIAQSAQDCRIVFDAMTSSHASPNGKCEFDDSTNQQSHLRLKMTQSHANSQSSRKKIKLGVIQELFSVAELPRECHLALQLVREAAANQGAANQGAPGVAHFELDAVSLPLVPYLNSVYSVLCAVDFASNMSRYDAIKFGANQVQSHSCDVVQLAQTFEENIAQSRNRLSEAIRVRIGAGTLFSLRHNRADLLRKCKQIWRMHTAALERAFETFDVLLCPSWIGEVPEFSQSEADSVQFEDIGNAVASLAGCPAISVCVPGLRSARTALPIGLQLIAPRWADRQLLLFAQQFENALLQGCSDTSHSAPQHPGIIQTIIASSSCANT